jgi:hypothetical protein
MYRIIFVSSKTLKQVCKNTNFVPRIGDNLGFLDLETVTNVIVFPDKQFLERYKVGGDVDFIIMT